MSRAAVAKSATRFLCAAALWALALAPVGAQPASYRLEPVYPGLSLALPVSVLPVGDGTDRLLVVQLDGIVVVVENGELRERPFLTLRTRVTALAGEQGLYSVALEDARAAAAAGRTRLLVAAYSERDTGDLIVASFATDAALTEAVLESESVLLRVPMPEPFHYGGHVAFAPDGTLLISVGNGERDPRHAYARPATSQSLSELRGKLLRIRLSPDAGGYSIPPDNPYADPDGAPAGTRAEIYASGFRNPWKLVIDPVSARLLVADVGEDRWEEINDVVPGGNYGWPAREGRECQRRLDGQGLIEPDCERLRFDDPLIAYGHPGIEPEGGSAVVAGAFVRDPLLFELSGQFVYADFVFGRVWAYDFATARSSLLIAGGMPISSITTGPRGEVLITTLAGELLRLAPAGH